MAGNGQQEFAAPGKVVALPRRRKTSLSLTLLEFSHALVLMLWVGSLAGFTLVVVPSLFSSIPSRETAMRAVLDILEQTVFLGCGAGAFLLLTTLLMHLLSLRETRATLAQMLLLLLMTTSAVGSQLLLTPKLTAMLRALPGPLESLAPDDPARVAFGRLISISMAVLAVQIAAGVGVLLFAVRRWYRYLPERKPALGAKGGWIDPRLR